MAAAGSHIKRSYALAGLAEADHQIEIFALLQRLVRQGFGVGVVTHDINVAAQFCDSLSLLYGEGVLAHGTPREVLTEPLLSQAYGSRIQVCDHPLTGMPLVNAVPGEEAPS